MWRVSPSPNNCCGGHRCFVQVSKLHHDLEEAIHTNTQLLADSSAHQVELKAKEEELTGLRVEILKVIKVCFRLGLYTWAGAVPGWPCSRHGRAARTVQDKPCSMLRIVAAPAISSVGGSLSPSGRQQHQHAGMNQDTG